MNFTATLVVGRYEDEPLELEPKPVQMAQVANRMVNTSAVKWDGAEVPVPINWQETTIRLATDSGVILGTLSMNRSWGLTLAQEAAAYLEIPVTGLEAPPGALVVELIA
jgi:hypothetical protein